MARYRQIILVLSLMMAMEGHLLQAAGPADFSGTWTLDLKAPEATSMAPILEAQGASRIERKAVDTLSITQVITQTEKTLSIKTNAALGGRTRVLYLDGSTQIQDTERTGKVESRSFWDKNGTVLVTVSKSVSPPDGQKQDSKKGEYTTRRYLQDEGRTLIVDHILTFDDGRKLTAKRVLRKQ
jgi:hypothetical protein